MEKSKDIKRLEDKIEQLEERINKSEKNQSQWNEWCSSRLDSYANTMIELTKAIREVVANIKQLASEVRNDSEQPDVEESDKEEYYGRH